MLKRIILTLLIGNIFAQVKPVEGLHNNTPRIYALTNATIVAEPGTIIEDGTIIIRDGVITATGSKVSIPEDAFVMDLTGKTVYAGFIESYWKKEDKKPPMFSFGDEKKKEEKRPVVDHWSKKVQPEASVLDAFHPSDKELSELRKLGFTTAQVVPSKGIFRGRSAIVHLGDWNSDAVITENGPAQFMAFEHGSWGDPGYPGSLMGSISLMRQTFYDANWYADVWQFYNRNKDKTESPQVDRALGTLAEELNSNKPFCFETKQELMALRVKKLSDEFGLNFWLKGSGYEYRRLNEIKDLNEIFHILFVKFCAGFVKNENVAFRKI